MTETFEEKKIRLNLFETLNNPENDCILDNGMMFRPLNEKSTDPHKNCLVEHIGTDKEKANSIFTHNSFFFCYIEYCPQDGENVYMFEV